MKTVIVFLILMLIFSCKSYQQKIEPSLFVKSYGTVEAINYTKGYFLVYWECIESPFKNKPCWAESKHLLRYFHEVHIGDTLMLTQNFR